MGRVTDALLKNTAYARGSVNPILDLQYGGQMGYAPNYNEWVSNAAYVPRNLICLLLEAPEFFQRMKEPEKWTQCLRSMVELHAKSIDGLNATLQVDVDDSVSVVGGGGEVQEEFTNVKRNRSNPRFTFVEKYGKPMQMFFYYWITHGMMDPESKIANIGTMESNRPDDMLPDRYSATMIFIEPDPTHRRVVQSWLCTNMWPKGTGDITGKRDLTSGGEVRTLEIEFTALTQHGLGSDYLAQALLDNINITNANPYMRPAFIDGISPDVAAQQKGYAPFAEYLGTSSLARP